MPERACDLWWLFTRQTVCVTKEEKIIDAALLMCARNFRHLPVVLNDTSKVVGIISAQDIIDSLNLALQSNLSSPEQIEDSLNFPLEKIMSISTLAVEPGDGLVHVIKKIVHHNVGALPVVNEIGIIQGIITLRDLVALIGMSSNPLNVPVSRIMNTNITTIRQEDSFRKAVQLMSERRVRRLPILSNKNKNELIGVITNKDILRYVLEMVKTNSKGILSGSPWYEAYDPSHNLHSRLRRRFETPVSELMTRDVITINENDDLRVAASRMMIFGVGGLVVTRDDQSGEETSQKQIGLITERDLIRTLSIKESIDFLMSAMQYESESESKLER
jgi:CBS domain-containing protein